MKNFKELSWLGLLWLSLMSSSCDKNKDALFPENYDISVMSFNLRYDEVKDGENNWEKRKEACVKMWKDKDPDLVGIQEGMENQVEYLTKHLPNYAWVGEKNQGGYYGEYKAIFYNKNRFDLLKQETFWLSETPEYPSYGWDASNIRCVTWVKLSDRENKGKIVYFFNTHLDHKGQTSRVESVKLLMSKMKDIVEDKKAPVFITGDFNTLIRNEALEPLLQEYFSAQRFAPYTDSKNSYNAFGRWYISRNIDFIFYKNAKALAYKTIKEDYGVPFISDHYPIISYCNY
jgi:endonuclease/exonuclease/phosphatase family metal-dependent hydrolase